MPDRLPSLIVVVVGLAGCSPVYEPHNAGVTGSIVDRDWASASVGSPNFLVKNETDACGIIFAVRSRTSIFLRDSAGHLRSASTKDLTVGRRVTVWSEFVMDSCPGQSTAERVEILPD